MASEPTSERLARDLEAAGLPAEMVGKARDGYYDDFKSPLDMPEMQLYHDLKAHGREDLADKVVQGEWDATPEESKAWMESHEGRLTMAELGPHAAKALFGVDVPTGVDRDMVIAAVKLIERAGGQDFEVGHLEDDVPAHQARWWAKCRIRNHPKLGEAAGNVVMVEELPGPDYAAEALARKLVDGGQCQHCKKQIRLNAPRSERNRVCRYRRVGDTWKRGCE